MDERIRAQRYGHDNEYFRLQRRFFAREISSERDFETLLLLGLHISSWHDFLLAEAPSYFTKHCQRGGIISPEKTAWLIHILSHDGVVETPLQLRLLIALLDIAEDSQGDVQNLAIDQLRCAIEGMKCSYRQMRRIDYPDITEDDAAYVLRILHRGGGERMSRVNDQTMNIIHQIGSLTRVGKNDPSWQKLLDQLDSAGKRARRPWLRLSPADSGTCQSTR
ncbi:hypothetical protein [Oryzifoliimicrobium ureilyticus]|uniref:hypothetical protein n=1 Tax=Oryzifoliimicrobium ureilyticus TaxID=3113724 RepID=UPI003076641E